MWVLKLETESENTYLAKLSAEYNLNFSGFPLGYRKVNNKLVVQSAGFVDEGDADLFFQSLKSSSFVNKVERKGDFFLASFSLPLWLEVLYHSDIIFIKPAKYNSGKEFLELGAWTKKPLQDLISVFKKKYRSRILSLKKKSIPNVSVTCVNPSLTEKQKQALKLAVDNGYYSFPRRITLMELAKIMGVSFSTYQAHLAKAEAYFIPQMFYRNK